MIGTSNQLDAARHEGVSEIEAGLDRPKLSTAPAVSMATQ